MLRGAGQNRLRTDLHQHRAAQLRHGTHAFSELHRLPGMPPPIVGVQRGLRRQNCAGAVAHQGQRRNGEFESLGVRLEFVERRFEQLGMEGVTGVQPRAADSVTAQRRDNLFQIRGRTRQHRVRAVVCRDRNLREFFGDTLHPLRVGEHRHHPAALGQIAEQAAAFGHQSCPVLEAEHSGHACRRVLAHAVPEHHVGLDAPRLPQPRQAHLDGEQRRLGKRGVPQCLSGLVAGIAVGVEDDL